MTNRLNINCDLGESYGNFKIGNDSAIFPYLSSCNIACGFHGGDPLTIEKTIAQALKYKVQIGAHPSYPDLQGFGRRKMDISQEELFAIIQYQVCALKGMVEAQGGKLKYVKPHGALYNAMTNDKEIAHTMINVLQSIDKDLKLMALAGSSVEKIAHKSGIGFIAEAFGDRTYKNDGTLLARSQKNAVLHNPQKAVEQILSIANQQQVISNEGKTIKIQADSICIHGDHPNSLEILKILQTKFSR